MLSSRTVVAVLMLTPWAPAHAEATVYRYEDADGVAVFADRPGSDGKLIELPAVNTYAPLEAKQPVAATTPEDTAATYQSVAITSPGDGETLRRNGGNVYVTGRVEPALGADHSAVLYIDGAVAASGRGDQAINFALAGVPRGPHTLRIAIVDREQNVLIQSAAVSFHLIRAAAGLRK